MQELITVRTGISHEHIGTELVELIAQQLQIEGGNADQVVQGDLLFGMTIPSIRIEYEASYNIVSSDGAYTFAQTVNLAGEGDDEDAVPLRLMELRAAWLNRSYRDVMRGIANIGAAIENGSHVLPAGTSAAKYLSDLAYAAVDAFPASN
jgi:hypothetical protein